MIIIQRKEADVKILKRADEFILSERTNGEFINSARYLDYHPEGRFRDASVIVVSKTNKEVCGVLMAAEDPADPEKVVSHPGTTFSGPVLNHKAGIRTNIEILGQMLDWYESRYQQVELRLRPSIYDAQPMEYIPYELLRRGYQMGMTALANVVDISGADTLQERYRLYDASRRNHVKKAVREGKYIYLSEEGIPEVYWQSLNENLGGKYGASATHTRDEILSLQELCPGRIQLFATRRICGAYGAFALVYRFKHVFHTQYLDMNYQYSSEYPHLYLIHELIATARQEGYRWFSFGASTEKKGSHLNQGLYNYKDGYGGGSIVLPVYTKQKKSDSLIGGSK